jgi:hypothetical protein
MATVLEDYKVFECSDCHQCFWTVAEFKAHKCSDEQEDDE